MLHLVSFEVCVLLVQRVLDKLIILSYVLLHLWLMRIAFIDSSIIFLKVCFIISAVYSALSCCSLSV